MTRTAFAALAALTLALAPRAGGQIITPPPPAPEGEPEFVPPPLPEPRVNPNQQERERLAAERRRQMEERRRQAEEARRERERQSRVPTPASRVPPFEHVPLSRPLDADPDDAGPLPTYPEGVHLAALTRNPLIDPGNAGAINEAILDRHRRVEEAAIDNLAVLIETRQGLLDAVSIENLSATREVTERVRPLILTPNPTVELLRADALSADAAGANIMIIADYQRAENDAANAMAQAGAGDDDAPQDNFFRRLLRQELREAQFALDLLTYEATTRLDEVLRGIDIPGAERRRLLRAAGDTKDSVRAKVEQGRALQLAWRRLDVEDQQQILRRVIETREDQDKPAFGPVELTAAEASE